MTEPLSASVIVHAGRAELGVDWSDVFRDSFQRIVQVSEQADRPTAANFALTLVGTLETKERQLTLSVILRIERE